MLSGMFDYKTRFKKLNKPFAKRKIVIGSNLHSSNAIRTSSEDRERFNLHTDGLHYSDSNNVNHSGEPINVGKMIFDSFPIWVFALMGSVMISLLVFLIILFEIMLAPFMIEFPIHVYFF